MTSFNKFQSRNRDIQDGIERHGFSEIIKEDGGGHIVKVKGNATEDEEATYMSIGGIGIRLPKDTDAEVHLFSGGSDTCAKFAVICIPAKKERAWKEGTNGIQHFDDGERALEFNQKRSWITDENAAMGKGGAFEVKGGDTYIRGNIYLENPPIIGTPPFEE